MGCSGPVSKQAFERNLEQIRDLSIAPEKSALVAPTSDNPVNITNLGQ